VHAPEAPRERFVFLDVRFASVVAPILQALNAQLELSQSHLEL
jgi:hypothetical protein